MVKTVRFTKGTEKSGKPEPYTLWVPPEKDGHFQFALKAHRVMTVHQTNGGTKADSGEIGFVKGEQASFLVFPKSLKPFEGKRVVGIKYDLLEQAPPVRKPEKAKKPVAKTTPKPKPKRAKSAKSGPPPPSPPVVESLRIFRPEEEMKPKRAKKPADMGQPAGGVDTHKALGALTREVQKAVKKLEQGNAVAAFQILEKALARE